MGASGLFPKNLRWFKVCKWQMLQRTLLLRFVVERQKNAISHFAPMDVLIEGVANSAAANAILILPGLIVASRFARRDARDMAAA